MPVLSRFAICNELFRGWGFDQTCAAVREIGYAGLEIAPFTLAENAVSLSPQDRRAIKDTLARHDLSFVGFHWLLASPPEMNAVSADAEQRKQTWAYLEGLIDLAADLAGKERPVLVFGSPKQRSTHGQLTRAQATQYLEDGLADLAEHARVRDICVLLEPLSADQCDVVNSIEEAVKIVKRIGSPAVQTMFDVHNAVDESLPHSKLIRLFLPNIRHIHLNEMDGGQPGVGTYNFEAVLETLSKLHYAGWISLEIFDFERDPELVAKGAFVHLAEMAPSRHFAHTL